MDTIAERLNGSLKDEGMKAEFDAGTNSFVIKDSEGNKVDYTYGTGVAEDMGMRMPCLLYTSDAPDEL